jgi:hypothetical protein
MDGRVQAHPTVCRPELSIVLNDAIVERRLFGRSVARGAWGESGGRPALKRDARPGATLRCLRCRSGISGLNPKTPRLWGLHRLPVAVGAWQVGLGLVFHQADEAFASDSLPFDDLVAVALLVYFGVRTLQVGPNLPTRHPEFAKFGTHGRVE